MSCRSDVHTREEFCYIVGFAVDDHPARVLGVVLGNRGTCEFAYHD